MTKSLIDDFKRIEGVDVGDTSTFYAFMAVNNKAGDAFRKRKIRESNVKAAIDACDGTLIVRNDAMFNKTVDSIINYCYKGAWTPLRNPPVAGKPTRRCLVVNIPFIDTLEHNVARVMEFIWMHGLTSLCVVGSTPELYDSFNQSKLEELGLFFKMLLTRINDECKMPAFHKQEDDDSDLLTPSPVPLKMPMLRRYKHVVSYVPKTDAVGRQKRFVELIEKAGQEMDEKTKEKGSGRIMQNAPVKRLRLR